MRFTHFTLTQDGQGISSADVMEQAVNSAQICAAVTGKPVFVIAHIEGGGSREAVFNPDGTNQNICLIEKGKPLAPVCGEVYRNRAGGEYRCISQMPATGALYYNQSGGSSDTAALFRNVKSGWTFVAKGIIQYVDGTIEWDHSTDGHFEDITKGE